MMKKRFGILHVIASIFKVLGIVIAVITVIAALITFIFSFSGGQLWKLIGVDVNTGFFAGLLVAFIILLLGGLYALVAYGYGELINLLLSLEENTRNTVALLEKSKDEPTVS
jgi:hypothetical protein